MQDQHTPNHNTNTTADKETQARSVLGLWPTNRELGQAIRELRTERHITIEKLAHDSNMHATYLSGIERGQRNPTWEKIRALAFNLDIPLTELARRAESAGRIHENIQRIIAAERARLRAPYASGGAAG
jgi:transcriptional regulator with XRE-family HTH domain